MNVPMISIRIIKQYRQIFYETVKLWTLYVGESENQKYKPRNIETGNAKPNLEVMVSWIRQQMPLME